MNRTKTPPEMDGWAVVDAVSQPFQAELLKASLEQQGFQVLILNKRDSSYGAFGLVEVYVPTGEAARAKAWLDSLHSNPGGG